MPKPIESMFHVHSFGYAAENKELNSRELEVFPVETLTYVDGEIASFKDKLEDEGVDANGVPYKVEALVGNSLLATWIPFGSNRKTPPDVRRGERLLLWRYADVDLYYWSTCGLDDVLRKLETVVYAWSNTQDESVKILDETNTYYFQVSTHLKLVTFATSKSDGEPFAYTIQINTKTGVLTVADDAGNYIELDSAERRIHLENADGSTYTMDKTNIHTESTDTISHKTKTFTVVAETATITATTTTIDGKQHTTGDAVFDAKVSNLQKDIGSTHLHTSTLPGTPTSPVSSPAAP